MTIISLKAYSDVYIKTFYGYVERPTARKGVGSTDGQSAGNPEPQQAWTPKSKEAERFLGEPGEIIETFDKNGERRLTKIGEDGKATRERHYSDHNKGHMHSNPHDHNIDWTNGKPNFSSPINYTKENIPVFKKKEIMVMNTKNEHILEYPKYKNMNDFKESLIYGREIVIKWKDTEYSIERNDNLYNAYSVCEANKPETEIYFNSFCELLDFKLKSNDRLKEIITKAEVVWRNI